MTTHFSVPDSCTFVFVCQQGNLEPESLLLTASISLHVECRHNVVVAIPKTSEKFVAPNEKTLQYLQEFGVEIQYIENDFIQSIESDEKAYRVLNKCYALRDVHTNAARIVFLDTDRLVHSFTQADLSLCAPPVVALRGDWTFAERVHEWEAAYAQFDCPIPTKHFFYRQKVSNKDGTLQCPCMPSGANSSFLSLDTTIRQEFCSEWIEYFKKLIEAETVSYKYFIEQVALSVLLAKTQTPHVILDTDIWEHFSHYADRSLLIQDEKMLDELCTILTTYPHIREYLQEFPKWWAKVSDQPYTDFLRQHIC